MNYHFSLDANGNRTQAIIDNEAILPTVLVHGTQSQSYNPTRNRLLYSSEAPCQYLLVNDRSLPAMPLTL